MILDLIRSAASPSSTASLATTTHFTTSWSTTTIHCIRVSIHISVSSGPTESSTTSLRLLLYPSNIKIMAVDITSSLLDQIFCYIFLVEYDKCIISGLVSILFINRLLNFSDCTMLAKVSFQVLFSYSSFGNFSNKYFARFSLCFLTRNLLSLDNMRFILCCFLDTARILVNDKGKTSRSSRDRVSF